MEVILRSPNCDVPDKVKDTAREKVEHATRIFDRLTGLEVFFSEEQNPRIPDPAKVEITARTKGHTVRAVGAGDDHGEAVERAVNRLERQLRRYKSKLVDSRRHSNGIGEMDAAVEAEVNSTDSEDPEPDPSIVRRKEFDLTAMFPDDAVLQLELLGHDFFLFVNQGSGKPAVVYRREQGDIGLIEGTMPQPATVDSGT